MRNHGNHQMYGKVNTIAQRKILRVFNLINLLAASRMKVECLAKAVETTPRTVYRYFNMLEEVGFCIERDALGRYYLTTQYYPVFVHVFRKSIETREQENGNGFLPEEVCYG